MQLPSTACIFAVGNRERLVELIAALERGAPLSVVKGKATQLDKEARAWQNRAQKFNVPWVPLACDERGTARGLQELAWTSNLKKVFPSTRWNS